MAHRKVYAANPFRYGTRMLQAGDGPIQMSGPDIRLHRALGNITLNRPRKAKAQQPVEIVEPTAPAPAPTIAPAAPAEVAEPPIAAKPPNPLDHDNDGKSGGSKKGAASTRTKGAQRKAAANK